jgi:hypothetical protein
MTPAELLSLANALRATGLPVGNRCADALMQLSMDREELAQRCHRIDMNRERYRVLAVGYRERAKAMEARAAVARSDERARCTRIITSKMLGAGVDAHQLLTEARNEVSNG